MSKPSIRLKFFGAAKTVTGSRFLLEVKDKKILFDCGLFQGKKEIREKNWHNPPFEPREIDAVILTHAHICLLYTSPSPRDATLSRMPSSA